MLAFIAVRSEEAPGTTASSNARRKSPWRWQGVHHVAGDDCYLLKVRARDAEHIGQLLRHRFGRIPGVCSTRTTIVLKPSRNTLLGAFSRSRCDDPVSTAQEEARLVWWIAVCLIWGTTYLGDSDQSRDNAADA